MDLTEQPLSELKLGYTVGDQVVDRDTCEVWTVWGINRANRVIVYNLKGEVRVLPASRLDKNEPKA